MSLSKIISGSGSEEKKTLLDFSDSQCNDLFDNFEQKETISQLPSHIYIYGRSHFHPLATKEIDEVIMGGFAKDFDVENPHLYQNAIEALIDKHSQYISEKTIDMEYMEKYISNHDIGSVIIEATSIDIKNTQEAISTIENIVDIVFKGYSEEKIDKLKLELSLLWGGPYMLLSYYGKCNVVSGENEQLKNRSFDALYETIDARNLTIEIAKNSSGEERVSFDNFQMVDNYISKEMLSRNSIKYIDEIRELVLSYVDNNEKVRASVNEWIQSVRVFLELSKKRINILQMLRFLKKVMLGLPTALSMSDESIKMLMVGFL